MAESRSGLVGARVLRGALGRRPPDLAIFGALAGLIAVCTAFLSPVSAWWNSMGFGGWCAPIANRIAHGERLYLDFHLPLPPLSFVTLAILGRGHATLLLENLCSNLCTACMVVVGFAILRRLVHPGVALVASVALLVKFLQFPNRLLYNSMPGAAVAIAAYLLVRMLEPRLSPAPRGPSAWRSTRFLAVVLGLVSAFCLLAKQSTGMGLVAGVSLAIGLALSARPALARIKVVGLYGLATIAFTILGAMALAPWADSRGMIVDCLLRASEPKGGASQLGAHLASYVLEFGRRIGSLTVVVAGVCLFPRARSWVARLSERPCPAPGTETIPLAAYGVVAAALASTGLVWLLAQTHSWIVGMLRLPTRLLVYAGWAWLLVLFFFGRRRLFAIQAHGRSDVGSLTATDALFILSVLLVPAAIGANLSQSGLVIAMHNFPAEIVFFGVVALLVDHLLAKLPSAAGRWALLGLVIPMQWHTLMQIPAPLNARHTWPEVAYTRGSYFEPSHDVVRDLVYEARRLAPAPTDAVLLLPGEPLVEESIGRPRPRLRGGILFVDQYWDRFVDEDLATIRSTLPKVIAIGPSRFREFFHVYAIGRGAERLVDRVLADVVPAHYRLAAILPLHPNTDAADRIDLYVRNDGF